MARESQDRPVGRITSRGVAQLAGVSQATVSRVFSDDPRVKPETRERVLRVAAETRYEPNAAARAFKTSRSGSIGVVVAVLNYPLYAGMLGLISTELIRHGLRMIVWDAEHEGDLPASRALRQGIVDGVLMTAATSESAFLKEIDSEGAPIVLLNRTVEEYGSDQISSDNHDGGLQVATYLAAAGRQRPGLIGGGQRASNIRDRESGFRAGLQAAGVALPTRHSVTVDVFSHASGFAAAQRLLELGDRPDALFCVNDMLALGAMDGARAMGLRIPEDLWVVGYDDVELASWGAYQLTTVRQPMQAMIAQAVELLVRRIEDPAREIQRLCLPNDLVIRNSTARTVPAPPARPITPA